MRMEMNKTDNRGFTLVELLVAICILSIIAVPLLHSFVSSFRVNAKSRETLRATTLAQNEMEIFEKEKIADLCDPEQFAYSESRLDGYQVDAPDTAEDNGCYVFSRKGIINDASGRQEFDVYITLDPKRADSGQRYYDENGMSLLSMNTISTLDTGTYVQAIRTENNTVDMDSVAYEYFDQKLSGRQTLEYIIRNVKRTITVDIEQEEKEIGTFTNARVTYRYELSTIGLSPSDSVYEETKVIFNNAQNFDEAGKPVELKSVYLFYAPRYGAFYTDEILVNNKRGLPVDIYIIRQEILKEGTSDILPMPADYRMTLSVADQIATDGKNKDFCQGRYHTNLNINEPIAEGVGTPIVLNLDDVNTVAETFSRDQAITAMKLKPIGVSETKDRIYEMTVAVYEAGANPATDAPVVKLTGTKLE